MSKNSASRHKKAFCNAEERRDWVQAWYLVHGFKLRIPLPDIQDQEFMGRLKQRFPQAPFYRPASRTVPFMDLLKAVDNGFSHEQFLVGWDRSRRRKIAWEPTKTGYWFWGDVGPTSRDRGIRWDFANFHARLMKIEEHVIVFWSHFRETGQLLESTWLGTRCEQGAIVAWPFFHRHHESQHLGGVCMDLSFGGTAAPLNEPQRGVSFRTVELIRNIK